MPNASDHAADDRGRSAKVPTSIPLSGWKDVLRRAWAETGKDNISLIAGGVTYFVLLALFPALTALVSLYGLFSNPQQVEQQVHSLSGVLPGGAQQVIGGQLHQLASSSHGALGIGLALSVLIALWSASRGMAGVINALNIAYDQPEDRGFIRRTLVALALTLGLLVAGIVAIALVAVLPAITSAINLGGVVTWAARILEWPLLAVVIAFVLAVLYRYAPNRKTAKWEWASPGAVLATVLWIVGSILFSVYVANFGSYNKTYGSLGALIGMLAWIYLSSYVVLFGAEVNAEAERQTRKNSTTGPDKPMGERGAQAADTMA